MKTIVCGIILVVLLGGCAPKVKLNLNLNSDAVENLPREMAIDYLNDTVQKYSYFFAVKEGYSCKYLDDGVVAGNHELEPIKYTDISMKWNIIQKNRGYTIPKNVMDIILYDSKSNAICGAAGVGIADEPYAEEFEKIATKVSTALKSLGVRVEK